MTPSTVIGLSSSPGNSVATLMARKQASEAELIGWRDVKEVNPEMLIGTPDDLAAGRHGHRVGPEEQLEADAVG